MLKFDLAPSAVQNRVVAGLSLMSQVPRIEFWVFLVVVSFSVNYLRNREFTSLGLWRKASTLMLLQSKCSYQLAFQEQISIPGSGG